MRYFKILPLILLITTGFYKASVLSLPIDITLLAAILNVLLVVTYFIKYRTRINLAVLVIGILFLLVLPVIHYHNLSQFAHDKTMYFYTLTLLSVITPTFLIKNEKDLKIFNQLLMGVCTIMVASAFVTLITTAKLSRLSALGASTTSLGRACGILFLYIFILTLQKKILYKISIPILCITLLMSFASGAKGPLLFTVLTAMIVFLIFRWSNKKVQLIALIGTVVILSLFIYFNKSILPDISMQRIEAFFNGDVSSSGSTKARITAYENSMESIKRNVFGIGFGNAEKVINVGGPEGIWLYQPHNLLLEALLECGWLTGAYLAFLLVFAICKAYQKAKICEEWKITFAILLLYVLNTLVASEMNDRMLFTFIGIAISYKPQKSMM